MSKTVIFRKKIERKSKFVYSLRIHDMVITIGTKISKYKTTRSVHMNVKIYTYYTYIDEICQYEVFF